ncbi:fimbrial protein [Pseudomonas syringae pv. actinidiae]|uniref:Pilin n=1 Tax=Pseudomonas syringae pv. actinidiae TaxID=103796 RepID=A0AAN4Q7K9_PSESF|nr:fimbrial protein [Pseudomonas syringae]EPN68056.1 type I fimbrial protein FimA [Pseudomonas syringae pv. actinidiae ICMP 19079]EPN68164.1 type I fimbrial protein FimA [Pseudomonas syringae pv. actinidiae ICMP 19101]AKT31407.1 pilus assembly protein [Pseudomonas syringae pv. actinidiae ICMP 18884]AOE57792.1 pilus assembly protein [Pseudomonas syringae pv. actinidiae ICMP 18708]APP98746.1 pilus assembly protein [Pseudomonas syringae pv. actinidiae]
MNKMLSALGLALVTTLTGTAVSANTGTINFEGQITSSTCPIEVVNPGDGSVGNLVKMGSVEASRFTSAGQEQSGKSFALRVNDNGSCGLTGASPVATVTFNGLADSSGSYFGVTPTADGAKNIAIVIKDHSGASIAPGTESAPYPLVVAGTTDMIFNAYYRSTAVPVEAGIASASVQFIVAIN